VGGEETAAAAASSAAAGPDQLRELRLDHAHVSSTNDPRICLVVISREI
jgi:hypothetical protein